MFDIGMGCRKVRRYPLPINYTGGRQAPQSPPLSDCTPSPHTHMEQLFILSWAGLGDGVQWGAWGASTNREPTQERKPPL